MAELIFGVSLSFLSYTYLLYPLLIFLLSKKYGRKIMCTTPIELPNITVMLCLYNSENLIEKRIVLINGKQLTELMLEYNLGVSTKETFAIKALDTDYFLED